MDRDKLLDLLVKVRNELDDIKNILSGWSKRSKAPEIATTTALTPTLDSTVDDDQPANNSDVGFINTTIDESHSSFDSVAATSEPTDPSLGTDFALASSIAVDVQMSSSPGDLVLHTEVCALENLTHNIPVIYKKTFRSMKLDLEVVADGLKENGIHKEIELWVHPSTTIALREMMSTNHVHQLFDAKSNRDAFKALGDSNRYIVLLSYNIGSHKCAWFDTGQSQSIMLLPGGVQRRLNCYGTEPAAALVFIDAIASMVDAKISLARHLPTRYIIFINFFHASARGKSNLEPFGGICPAEILKKLDIVDTTIVVHYVLNIFSFDLGPSLFLATPSGSIVVVCEWNLGIVLKTNMTMWLTVLEYYVLARHMISSFVAPTIDGLGISSLFLKALKCDNANLVIDRSTLSYSVILSTRNDLS